MTAMRNLVHGGILAIWVLLGLLFSVKMVWAIAAMPALWMVGSYWLWFAGYAGITTYFTTRFEKPVAPLLVHGATYLVLLAVPQIFPLSLLRLGIDLLARA